MAKILGLHEVRLREGVTGEELEEFIRKEMCSVPFLEGWDGFLLKRRTGPCRDDYLILWAMDEERHPHEHPEILAEYERWKRNHAGLWKSWREIMATMEEHILIADYAIVAKF